MAINTCNTGERYLAGPMMEAELSAFLTEAKEAHTRYEGHQRAALGYVPEHSWEDWYARYIFERIAAEGF